MNLTIEAEALDAARGGVLVVDGEQYDPQVKVSGVTVVRPQGWTRAEMSGEYPVQAPVEFVKLTEPCKACDGSGHATFGNQVRTSEKCPACDGSGRPWLTVEWESSDVAPIYLGHPMTDSFRAHVLDVVPIVASAKQGGFDRVKAYPSGEASLFRAKPSADDLRDITLPPGDHVGRYAILIEPEES